MPYDIRVEFERGLDGSGPPDASVKVREAELGDEAVVAELAAHTISATRFTRDAHFPQDRIPRLYAEWVRRGLRSGSERRVLLAEPNAGFVVCGLHTGRSTGSIELIGVDSHFARRGIGRALVGQAHAIMVEAGCARAHVVTQGDNVPAQRLYQSHGYRTLAVAWWLHRWTGG
jgi:ribosomal protein S18 acetylase RimI-like enzyme